MAIRRSITGSEEPASTDPAPAWLKPLPTGPVRFAATLRTAGQLAQAPSVASRPGPPGGDTAGSTRTRPSSAWLQRRHPRGERTRGTPPARASGTPDERLAGHRRDDLAQLRRGRRLAGEARRRRVARLADGDRDLGSPRKERSGA